MIIKYLFLFLTIQAATAQVNNKLIVNYEAKSILKVEDLSPEIRSNTIQMKYIYMNYKKNMKRLNTYLKLINKNQVLKL